jgi:hypothetical protein
MTDKAIEALKVLSENTRHKAGIEFGGLRDNEATRSAIVALIEFSRAALEAKAEPVAHKIEMPDDKVCFSTACPLEIERWRGHGAIVTPLCPAEVKAQALEEAGRDMVEHFKEQGLDMTMALAVQEGLAGS